VLGDEAPPRNEAELFERLAEAGHFGLVLQKPLVRRLPRRSGVGLVV
jgi:hypothetical protein